MGASINELLGKTFDYVIVGGGTAGLTLAARLTEDSDISVAVLEAGPENLNDPLINSPAQFYVYLGNPKYDWCFMTEPQKHSNDQRYLWSRGKTLGGSSAINFSVWSNPPAPDVDAWEKLGNPGWNWDRYQKYAKEVEGFTLPKEAYKAQYKQSLNPTSHGYSGPLKTMLPEFVAAGEVPFQETLQNMGIPIAKDPIGGDPIGTSITVKSLDPQSHERSYSAMAYYLPNKDRPNFKVLCDALVRRVLTTTKDGGLVATGVEFEHGGDIHSVYARKEVLLCAGALQTPKILELSGIGDRRVLEPLGIEAKVHLPGVGANLQEHNVCVVVFELDSKRTGSYDTVHALGDVEYTAEQLRLHSEQNGFTRYGMGSVTFTPFKTIASSSSYAETLISQQRERIEANAASYPPGLKEQYQLQLECLERGRGGDCEIVSSPQYFFREDVSEPGKTYMTVIGAVNHPFSRGTVHITTVDPHIHPAMDPHYFEEEFDLKLYAEVIKFIRRMPETEPFKGIIVKEVHPGPKYTTDASVKDYIKNNMSTTHHTAGTAAMRPRDKNGVVDTELKVYGTTNIRVVDLSVVPLHIAAHTQALAYVIAEAAADIIKGRK